MLSVFFSSVAAMAVLVQGGPQTWGLSAAGAGAGTADHTAQIQNKNRNRNKKSVVLVKLTDSSLKALEQYLKNPVRKLLF